MIMYPDVQRQAQAEIDTKVGSYRLPLLSDRPNLPYINAMYKEIIRWHCIVPIGKRTSCGAPAYPESAGFKLKLGTS